MKKTKKFYISFSSVETDLVTDLEISQKDYWSQMKHLENVMEEFNKDVDNELDEMTKHSYTSKFEHTTQYEDVFTHGCSQTVLTRLVCDEGYCFTKGGK